MGCEVGAEGRLGRQEAWQRSWPLLLPHRVTQRPPCALRRLGSRAPGANPQPVTALSYLQWP